MSRWGSCDFRELEKLQEQLEKMQQEQDAFCQKCAKELAARLLAKVIKRTPTGRAPKLAGPKTVRVKGSDGKMKSVLSRKGAILQQYWSGYQGGTLKRAWTENEISKVGNNFVIEITNPTEYASYVEYGHRQKPGRYVPALGLRLKKAWVPGKLMMTISERELQTMAPKLLEKKLNEWLRGCLDA